MEITVDVGAENLTDWCLGLCLLASKRLSALVVRSVNPEPRPLPCALELRRAEDIETGGRAQKSPDGLVVYLGRIGLTIWLDASVACLQGGRPVREALPGIEAVRSGQLREVTLYLTVAGRQQESSKRRSRKQ